MVLVKRASTNGTDDTGRPLPPSCASNIADISLLQRAVPSRKRAPQILHRLLHRLFSTKVGAVKIKENSRPGEVYFQAISASAEGST